VDLPFTLLRLNRASAAGVEGTVSPGCVGAPLPVEHVLTPAARRDGVPST